MYRSMSKITEVCLSLPINFFVVGTYMFVRCSYAENLEISWWKGDSIVNIFTVLEVSFNNNHQILFLFLYILFMLIRTSPWKCGLYVPIFMCHFSLCHVHVKKLLFLLYSKFSKIMSWVVLSYSPHFMLFQWRSW